MQSIPDAIALMLPCFSPRSAERVVLHDALGRHLSQSLDARACLPAFSNSAMDGYAVRNADLRGASESAPVRLPRRGESRAGGGLPEALEEGAVMRIFTGAPMPEGADAVVAQEDTTEADGVVELRVSPSPGRHVRARASDLALGASLLPAGARIGSGEIALLARIAKLPEVPSSTGAMGISASAVVKLHTSGAASALPCRLSAPVVTVAVNTVLGSSCEVGQKTTVEAA